MQWVKQWGFSRYANVVMGPLLRATVMGRPGEASHMPIAAGSTYAHVPKALREAWQENVDQGIIDTALDLEGRDAPEFGNHGNRRHADKNASDDQAITGVSNGEVDDHFGWKQKERKKTSRLHYQGRLERLKRARVTMML